MLLISVFPMGMGAKESDGLRALSAHFEQSLVFLTWPRLLFVAIRSLAAGSART